MAIDFSPDEKCVSTVFSLTFRVDLYKIQKFAFKSPVLQGNSERFAKGVQAGGDVRWRRKPSSVRLALLKTNTFSSVASTGESQLVEDLK